VNPQVRPAASVEAQHLVEWLHWSRFRIPLYQDCMKSDNGDAGATKRVLATVEECEKRRSDPEWRPRFKNDIDHTMLFEHGLGLGLEKLTEEELEDCFNELCPCSISHSGDALRKQRNRFIRALRAAFVWEIKEAPKLRHAKAVRMRSSIDPKEPTR
jgi:hypothetical protein